MYTLTYTAAFEISDYETVTKNYKVEYETEAEAYDKAEQLYHVFDSVGPESYYNIRINGELVFEVHIPDDELPF